MEEINGLIKYDSQKCYISLAKSHSQIMDRIHSCALAIWDKLTDCSLFFIHKNTIN